MNATPPTVPPQGGAGTASAHGGAGAGTGAGGDDAQAATGVVSLGEACRRVPANKPQVTPAFVQDRMASETRVKGTPSLRLLPGTGDSLLVDFAEWTQWLETVEPERIKAVDFASAHSVGVEDVTALVKAGALSGTVHKLAGVRVDKHQPLVNPAMMVSVEEVWAMGPRVAGALASSDSPRKFALLGGQYLVRKEFDAWMATLPPPTTTLRAMVDFAGLTTVEDLLALWTELASAGDVGPLHAAAMSGDADSELPCAVEDEVLTAMRKRVIRLSDLAYLLPDIVEVEDAPLADLLVPALRAAGVVIVRAAGPGVAAGAGAGMCAASQWLLLASSAGHVPRVYAALGEPDTLPAEAFAAHHGVCVEDVVALVRVGALVGDVDDSGVRVEQSQPLVNGAMLVPLSEASGVEPRAAAALQGPGAPRLFSLQGVKYLVRKEFLAWLAALPPPPTTLAAMTTSAGLATVADLLMLWTALASGSHIEPVPATAMSGEGNEEVSSEVGAAVVAAVRARTMPLSQLHYMLPGVEEMDMEPLRDVFVPALREAGVVIAQATVTDLAEGCAAAQWLLLPSAADLVSQVYASLAE